MEGEGDFIVLVPDYCVSFTFLITKLRLAKTNAFNVQRMAMNTIFRVKANILDDDQTTEYLSISFAVLSNISR